MGEICEFIYPTRPLPEPFIEYIPPIRRSKYEEELNLGLDNSTQQANGFGPPFRDDRELIRQARKANGISLGFRDDRDKIRQAKKANGLSLGLRDDRDQIRQASNNVKGLSAMNLRNRSRKKPQPFNLSVGLPKLNCDC